MEGKARAAVCRIRGGDGNIVARGDRLGNGQTKAGAAGICAPCLPVEPLENMRQFFRRDSAAVVAHRDAPACFVDGGADFDRRAVRGELNGVVEDNQKHLPQTAIVCV